MIKKLFWSNLTYVLINRFANDIVTALAKHFNTLTVKARNSSAYIYRINLISVLKIGFSL